jgi:WD40 repeat protein
VTLGDVVTGLERLTRAGHPGQAKGVAFSPDGHQVALVGLDQTGRVWDTATGQELRILLTYFPMQNRLKIRSSRSSV